MSRYRRLSSKQRKRRESAIINAKGHAVNSSLEGVVGNKSLIEFMNSLSLFAFYRCIFYKVKLYMFT